MTAEPVAFVDRRAVRVGLALVLVVLGALVGTASVLVHGRTVGLVLAIVASATASWALPGGFSLRFPYTVGWVLVLAYALVPRGAGGYLIGSDLRGYLLLGFGLALMLYGIITVRPLRPPAAEPPEPGS